VIAVAASADQVRLTQEIYGDEVGYIHWLRPGFELGMQMQAMAQANPALKGLVMGQHGLINWADDDKACYELSLRLTDQAARYIAQHDKGADTFGGAKYQSLSESDREALLGKLLPRLRGMVSQSNRFLGTVHVTGSYLVSDEAKRIWQAQGLSGSLVLTTSANSNVVKTGSFAYDTSKAAVSHLIRELALDLAPLVRVNGLSPATVVGGSGMFPRDRVIASLTKYDIAFDESEETESLREKLSRFCAQRTLMKSPITVEAQAEAAYLLASGKLPDTTGQILNVDGGLLGAFLR
jgi:hypothetical protein